MQRFEILNLPIFTNPDANFKINSRIRFTQEINILGSQNRIIWLLCKYGFSFGQQRVSYARLVQNHREKMTILATNNVF
jgi:hypothetical protein